MAHKILVEGPLPPEILEMLGNEYQVHIWTELPEAEWADAVGLLTYGHPQVDGRFMDRVPRIKLISNFGVGVDHIDLEAAKQRGLPVGNTPSLLDGATADMTFGLILATARLMVVGDRYARSPEFIHFDPSYMLGTEVHSTVMGIIGLGNIGYQVAKRGRGFDMEILYHNRRPNLKAEADLAVRRVALDELLEQADFVVLNMPLTDETEKMIGAQQFGLMKESAILINTARGGVVDHDALVTALQSGQIAAAGLDVTEPEPLPRNHPLLSMDNVIIMPHLGSATRQTRLAMAQRTVDNLKAVIEGREMITRVV
jgi:glyoxylate reductase